MQSVVHIVSKKKKVLLLKLYHSQIPFFIFLNMILLTRNANLRGGRETVSASLQI